jgi:hypothetical protein
MSNEPPHAPRRTSSDPSKSKELTKLYFLSFKMFEKSYTESHPVFWALV